LCFNSLSVLATARRREGPWKSNTESSLPSIFSGFWLTIRDASRA
ncbi:hypothetical protein T06_3006, partial [Trichinella sp. T6]